MRSSELSPLKQAILEAVQAAGSEGISAVDLMRLAYQGRIGLPDPRTLKSHISQLNDALADTDIAIRSARLKGQTPRYRMVTRRKAKGADGKDQIQQ